MAASCKGGIWSDTNMLHYQWDVCGTDVTSAALIPTLILAASPLPYARAVCHGWFGNKMRKVLSQRQKSPFHLVLCHPSPLSPHTFASAPKCTCTNSLSESFAQARSLSVTRTRLHTGIQANTRCAEGYGNCKYNSYLSLFLYHSLVLFPNLPDTRCLIFTGIKLALKTFCAADYSVHKFAVKQFYTGKLWCATWNAIYRCLCQMQEYALILKITVP